MARRKQKRSKPKQKVPLGITMGLLGSIGPSIQALSAGDVNLAINRGVRRFTGVDPTTGQFSQADLKAGLLPLLAGAGISMLGSKVINKKLRIPFIKV